MDCIFVLPKYFNLKKHNDLPKINKPDEHFIIYL